MGIDRTVRSEWSDVIHAVNRIGNEERVNARWMYYCNSNIMHKFDHPFPSPRTPPLFRNYLFAAITI